MTALAARLGLSVPLIQAPMAGVSTPALAAAVCEAGALGSIALGATDAAGGRAMIDAVRAATTRAFNVNLFVHADPVPDDAREAAWRKWLAPEFARFGAQPPATLRTIYRSFADDTAMLAMLVQARPAVVSFHFGLPSPAAIHALKATGALLMATATDVAEAQAIERAGVDVIVAQGIEAGGHRGMFDPGAPDEQLGTLALTRLLVRRCGVPVVAAGGIMDGSGIAAALALGAEAAQLGTAFIACPESAASAAYRAALAAAERTRMTALISGRPARCLVNRFTELAGAPDSPGYPIAYDAGKALHAAASARGEHGYGAHWAGQGARLARALPAATLVATLRDEVARAGLGQASPSSGAAFSK
ncbi:nitronate monooxygenase [Sphingomonas sp. BE138]|uniref:NAD(P)H-dependent flavin oxidoreductase n=1 Tax=Sphingomonas sp. BE138 TaxID=2817845 RepID=UPI00285B8BBE|nr:nitronate monooxygenase [Sphingomonas sp. BE138]MDR6786999.1 nitronate monooxygenase [Sphingomonas sp. BE138]